MSRPSDRSSRQIASHVFTGSITMVGSCVMIIALFRAFNTSFETYADELLGFNTLLFLAASILSYAALRGEHSQRLERWADMLFLIAMVLMLGAAVLILVSAY